MRKSVYNITTNSRAPGVIIPSGIYPPPDGRNVTAAAYPATANQSNPMQKAAADAPAAWRQRHGLSIFQSKLPKLQPGLFRWFGLPEKEEKEEEVPPPHPAAVLLFARHFCGRHRAADRCGQSADRFRQRRAAVRREHAKVRRVHRRTVQNADAFADAFAFSHPDAFADAAVRHPACGGQHAAERLRAFDRRGSGRHEGGYLPA